jgi:hypothetical protein
MVLLPEIGVWMIYDRFLGRGGRISRASSCSHDCLQFAWAGWLYGIACGGSSAVIRKGICKLRR